MECIHNRVFSIDLAKSIGIYLVVLCHMQLSSAELWHFVYAFHMPLFFFISGLLNKDRSLKELTVKNAKRLLIPYVTFYTISYIWWIYFVFIRNSTGDYPPISFYACVIKPFLGMVTGVLHNTSYSYSTNVALWFILSLFELKIMLFMFNKMEVKKLKMLFLIITLYLAYYYQKNNVLLFYSFNSTLLNLPYFFAGYYFKDSFYSIINNGISKYTYILIFLICTLIIWFGSVLLLNSESTISGMSCFIINIFVAFCGIIMILALSFYLSYSIKDKHKIKIVRYISDNTLSIMGLHILFNGTLCGIVKNIFYIDTKHIPIFIAIVIACISVVLSLFFGSFLTKYVPRLVGKEIDG